MDVVDNQGEKKNRKKAEWMKSEMKEDKVNNTLLYQDT